ncbi:hypothetical protein [Parapedobacter soli]|uniref:hypothetical protein n=1 Tax=Parapedobacter soli TaxID=416955 RepID=UPI0021CA2038|nr:hypothetical protein [Parapedobacter soli]
MMTNKEAKQKAIREAWEAEGFIWNEVSQYLDEFGDMTLQNPELKAKITGYDSAVSRRALKGITLTGNGLWLRLERLIGVSNNNGWNRIDGPDTLPSNIGQYTVLGKSGKIEKWSFFSSPPHIDFWLEYFTHWRTVVELPKPIY